MTVRRFGRDESPGRRLEIDAIDNCAREEGIEKLGRAQSRLRELLEPPEEPPFEALEEPPEELLFDPPEERPLSSSSSSLEP